MGTNNDRTTQGPRGKHVGRLVKYYNTNDHREAIKASKRKHKSKPWHRNSCNRTYTIVGKGMHCKSLMYRTNLQ